MNYKDMAGTRIDLGDMVIFPDIGNDNNLKFTYGVIKEFCDNEFVIICIFTNNIDDLGKEFVEEFEVTRYLNKILRIVPLQIPAFLKPYIDKEMNKKEE